MTFLPVTANRLLETDESGMCDRPCELKSFTVGGVGGSGSGVEHSEVVPVSVVADDDEEFVSHTVDTHCSEWVSVVGVLGRCDETQVGWVDAQRVKASVVDVHAGWAFSVVVQFPRVDVCPLLIEYAVAHGVSWCFVNASGPYPAVVVVWCLVNESPKPLFDRGSGPGFDSVGW